MKVSAFFRQLVALLLLYFAWTRLEEWYFFRARIDFLIYFALSCAAYLIAAAGFLRANWRSIFTKRILLVMPLLVVVLIPWGELFRINYPNTREDWARQIL